MDTTRCAAFFTFDFICGRFYDGGYFHWETYGLHSEVS